MATHRTSNILAIPLVILAFLGQFCTNGTIAFGMRPSVRLLNTEYEGGGTVNSDDDSFLYMGTFDVTATSSGDYTQVSEYLRAKTTYEVERTTILSLNVLTDYKYSPPSPIGNEPLYGDGMHYATPIWINQTAPFPRRVWFANNWLLGGPFGSETPPIDQPQSRSDQYSTHIALSPGTYDFDSNSFQTYVSAGKPFSGGSFGSGMSLATSSLVTGNLIDPRELIKNAVHLYPTDRLMLATFEPEFLDGTPVSPTELASWLGLKQFNWVQTVSGPGNMQIRVVDGSKIASGETVVLDANPTPTYDGVVLKTGVEQYQLRVDGDGVNDVQTVMVEADYADNHPPYLPIDNQLIFQNYIRDKSTIEPYLSLQPSMPPLDLGFDAQNRETLLFWDMPAVPEWALKGESRFMSFQTELVGITPQNEIVRFTDLPGTRFRWKSNCVFETLAGDVQRVAFLGGGPDDSYKLRGGVSEAEFLPALKPGDFNENGQFDAGDINYLSTELRSGTTDL
jgi:hypothetical protein